MKQTSELVTLGRYYCYDYLVRVQSRETMGLKTLRQRSSAGESQPYPMVYGISLSGAEEK
jgi:hypothetical protein